MTYQIIITEETSANIVIDNNTTNVSITTTEYPITIEYNAVITPAGGNGYGNSNVTTFLASGTNTGNIITTANVSGAFILGNGSQLTGISATYGNANVAANLAAFGSNPISTSGNITAGYFAGNGSLLTNITGANVTGTVANATYALNANAATYATTAVQANVANVANSVAGANVSGTVANATYALNSNAATFATQATFATTANAVAGANVSGTVANATYALNANASTFATQATFAGTANAVAGANVSGVVANATYALNSNAATFAGTVTTAAQPNITSVGILTAVNTSGTVSATGNITGNYFVGNGSLLTGIATSSYGNANVAANLAAFANNPISTSGNITAGNVIAPDVYTSNITGAAGQTVTITAEGTGDIHLDADSIRIGDNNTAATIVTHGTGNLILRTHEGDASQGNITLVNGVNGNIQLNPNGTGRVTTTVISATGNINGANLVASANLTSTQQIAVGTANTGTTGNIVMSGRNMATDMKFSPDGATGNALYTGRVMVGTGWAGNLSVGSTSRLAVSDAIERTNTSTNIKHFDVDSLVSLAANVTNSSFRQHGIGTIVRVGGGSAANTYSGSTGAGVVNAFAGIQPQVNIGNASPYFLGNTTISHASINGGFITMNSGSQLGNAYGMIPGLIGPGDGSANVTNYIGFSSALGAAGVVTGNTYAFYHPGINGSAAATATGLVAGAGARGATNYYAFRNDDNVAQVQLGSLRSYNEFQFSTATSGTVNIDKTNAQVQFLNPTANVTIGDFQNFVTTANDGVNNDSQSDTVTLVIQQGATPYTVTMPTGNAAIKYAGGVSTIGATANAVTMVSISAIRSAANATLYLASVSSEFS